MSDNTETSPIDLRDLLDAPGTEFPDRPNLPGGKHFFGKLLGISAGVSEKKGTPLFQFDIRLTDPGRDVTPQEIKAIADSGYSLADYSCGRRFYLTPKAMPMLWQFLEAIGFQRNVGLRTTLSLDADGNPTPETQDKIRGRDVIVKTPPADDQGRVFLNNVDQILGVKA